MLQRELFCYANQMIQKLDQARLPLNDLGLQRGYGIFDFLRIYGSNPIHLEDHLDRFFHSAASMFLNPVEDRAEVKSIIYELIKANSLEHSGIRLLLTGGSSEDGYSITQPSLIILQQSIAPPPAMLPAKGIHLFSYEHQRQLPEIKTTDYLMAIRLQPWLKQQKGDDLLYHQNKVVTECPRSNIFIVTKEGILVTPDQHMLKGITRKKILQVAQRLSIPVQERILTLEEIYRASEVFITSSTKRILPVDSLDGITIETSQQRSVMNALWEGLLILEQ